MVLRTLALLLISSLAACSAARPAAQAYKPPTQVYYAQEAAIQAINLAPPPADGSEADKADFAELLRLQAARTPEDCARVKREAASGYENFFGDMGIFTLPQPPAAAAFLKRVRADVSRASYVFKKRYARIRPFLRDPEVKPCLPLEEGYAYPSGHSALAMTMALALADIRPDMKARLEERAASVGAGRALGGVHHPSDVQAGLELGRLLHAEMAKSPAYAADLAAAAGCAAGADTGFRAVRSFEPVPAFGITSASVFEIDPARFAVRTVSARSAAGKAKATVQTLRKLLPGAALLVNAGFFNPADGRLIGDFVEGGDRPAGIIYAPGENLDRVFVWRRDGRPEVLEGVEKLDDERLAGAVSAVAGKSAWPGHANSTNRTAVCLTGSGRVLIAAVYPVRTLDALFAYMQSEGCMPAAIVNLDGGGSTQMSYAYGGSAWSFGWERKGPSVPECHIPGGTDDARCYRPVATFLAVEPLEKK